jgi:hypothetical protein
MSHEYQVRWVMPMREADSEEDKRTCSFIVDFLYRLGTVKGGGKKMTTVKLGQCYMVQLSKSELPVRLERVKSESGWLARALTHGRMVQVKDETQLLYRLTDDEVRGIAQGVIPNRRSSIQGAVFREQTVELTGEPAETITCRKVKRPPIQKIVIVERLNILDAAERVLAETQHCFGGAMTTREIVTVAKEKQYWISDAATPWATLHAALSRDIQSNTNSRFAKKERGRFGLR